MSPLEAAIRNLYLEVFPVPNIEEQLLGLPDGTYIGITCSPTKGINATLDLVESLAGHGFNIVPHVAARQVRDTAHLRDILACLAEQGIDSMFVPGGDIDAPVGEFSASLDVLRAMSEIGHDLANIGVAAHPEGHPLIENAELLEVLRNKQEFATYFVTQICFDMQVLVQWLRDIRRAGVSMPAWIGFPGVLNRTKLLQTSLRIGVGESARFLRKQPALAGKLLHSGTYRPDHLWFDIAPHLQDEALRIDGFYLFSFNQVRETVEWCREIRRHPVQS